MSDRRQEFNVGGEPAVELKIGNGSVVIAEGDPGQIIVEMSGRDRAVDAYVIAQSGDRVMIGPEGRRIDRWSRVDVAVTVPPGSDIAAKASAADITVKVDVSSLRASTAAGDIRANSVSGPAEIKTASGDVRLDHAMGPVGIQAASGDIFVASAPAGGSITTASGDLRIGTLGGRSRLRTAAGDVVVDRFEGENLEVKTLAGDVVVGFPTGIKLDLDVQAMSGELRHDFGPPSGEGTAVVAATIRTLSGDVTLRRA